MILNYREFDLDPELFWKTSPPRGQAFCEGEPTPCGALGKDRLATVPQQDSIVVAAISTSLVPPPVKRVTRSQSLSTPSDPPPSKTTIVPGPLHREDLELGTGKAPVRFGRAPGTDGSKPNLRGTVARTTPALGASPNLDGRPRSGGDTSSNRDSQTPRRRHDFAGRVASITSRFPRRTQAPVHRSWATAVADHMARFLCCWLDAAPAQRAQTIATGQL